MIEERTEALLAGPRGREACVHAAGLVSAAVEEVWFRTGGCSYEPPDPGLAVDLAGALRGMDPAAVTALDEFALLGVLASSVGSAMYWQPPWTKEAVIGAPAVVRALRPVASALAGSVGAAWWWTGVDVGSQHAVSWIWNTDPSVPPRPPPVDPASGLAHWRAENIAGERRTRAWQGDPAGAGSGTWWSTPRAAGVLDTARALGPHPVGLLLVEEYQGDFDDAHVREVRVNEGARVLEIGGPGDWVDLVRDHPLDASRSRRGDWYLTTGRDGAWCLPDWQQVAERWDGVHLTLGGYLCAAGRALDLGDGRATVLAGFDPDQTFWLRNVVQVVDDPRRWRVDEATDLLTYRPVP